MKTLLTATAALAIMATAAVAETSIEELFAMSNNSAAETLVRETSMGDVSAAQVSLALGNMSAAERMGFFEANMSDRLQILDAQMRLLDGDSAAESN